jgi:hypothetical protein
MCKVKKEERRKERTGNLVCLPKRRFKVLSTSRIYGHMNRRSRGNGVKHDQ